MTAQASISTPLLSESRRSQKGEGRDPHPFQHLAIFQGSSHMRGEV
jgi:hypothetical protein